MWDGSYNIALKDMPTTVKAVTMPNEDDTYTIIVNSRLSYEQQRSSFKHELFHINKRDFEKVCETDKIEYEAHKYH